MTRNQSAILIGILAGLAAGLMVLAGFRAGFAAMILVLCAPLAVYIASMGWGTLSGIVAALAASAMLFFMAGGESAAMTAALLFLPAAWVGHLVNLGQPVSPGGGSGTGGGSGPAMIWYPLPAILFRLMLALALGFILFGGLSGYNIEDAASEFSELMREIVAANPDLGTDLGPDDALIDERARLYAGLIPLIVPAVWLLFHVLVGYTAAAITRRSGRLARGAEPAGKPFIMPPEALGFIGAGLVGAFFLSGIPSLFGLVLLGLAIGGYAVAGLADLHQRVRNWPSGGFILGLTYGAIILFTLPLLIFSVSGLIRSLSGISNRPGPGGQGPAND